MRTFVPAASGEAGLPLPGEVLTRRAVTVITAAIVVMTFAFSLGNVTSSLDLGIIAWIAWLVAPAVDLSVVGLLTGIRFLSLHCYTDAQLAKPRRMLRFCGVLTLALNTSGALCHRQFGTTLVDAVGPALLNRLGRGRPVAAAPDLRRLRAHGASTAGTSAVPGPPCWPARAGPGSRRRAPRGNRQAHLPGHPPRKAADRPGPRQCPGHRRPRRSGRRSRGQPRIIARGLKNAQPSRGSTTSACCPLGF